MDMNEVPIFIASSIVEFEDERKELTDFINMLNDSYQDSGVRLIWDGPENMSHAIYRGGSQLQYDEKVLNSRFFILIVGHNLGKYTQREFNLALEQFISTDFPKIFPYFYAKGREPFSNEVLEFRNRLREKQVHYTDTYADFSQIKRRIQIDLERNGAFESTTYYQDRVNDDVEGEIDLFQTKVRQEIRHCEYEIRWLKKQSITQRVIVEITKSYEKITRLVQKTKVEPNALLNYMDFLWKQHLYDMGIALGQWLEKFYRLEEPGEATWARLKSLMGICYKKSNLYKSAEQYYREALEIRQRLAESNPVAYASSMAVSCNNLGLLLWTTNRMEEAEGCYRKALEIRRRLIEKRPDFYAPGLARSCNSLGLLLFDMGRIDEAEDYYREALEIRQRLAKKDAKTYEPDLATTYNNLGNLLTNSNRIDEAEECYHQALEIRVRLTEVNPVAFEPDLAMTYNDFGNLLRNVRQIESAERCYRKALEIRRRLVETNPAAYEPDLAMTCNGLGNLLKDNNLMKEAEDYYREALEIRRRLTVENPDVYGLYLAQTYHGLGLLGLKCNNTEGAKKYLAAQAEAANDDKENH